MGTKNLDHLVRDQFRLFGELGDDLAIPPDERRRLLLLSDTEWAAWSGLSGAGRLPAAPMPPLMLLRLGAANHRLVAVAERRAERIRDASAAWRNTAGPLYTTRAANAQEPASR